MIQNKLKELIKDALKNLDITAEQILLEHPGDLAMGDYSTNVAMALAKNAKINPKELAEKIVEELNALRQAQGESQITEIQSKNGFINFYLSPNYYFNKTKQILEEGENYGRSEIHKGKKILVEHSSPNLFKPFHIGHVMNNTIGESINRLARFSGAEVETISYPSDVSLGIGKAVWAFMDGGVEKLNEFKTEEEKLNYLGNCYVVGTKAMEEDQSLEPRMREITKIIYEHIDSPEYEAYKIGKEINLSYFKNITKSLGSNFDDFIYESEAGKEGEKIVRENTGSIFEKSDGAIIYKGEQDGLHTRVFINKEGYPTYEAKDVGLLSLKFSRYNPDLSIFITDHEQSEYFKVVVTAAGKINSIWKEKTIHRTHGRMSFKGQKMSSRLGGVPIASTLIQAVAEEVKEKSPESSEEIQNMIAISALKFTILKSMAGKNINFDPETSLSFEGDSGPYLQYSTVRSGSVLEKGHVSMEDCNQPETITDVEKYLDRFPEVAEQCISLWEPHHMVGYLLDLAQSFNSWYARVKIIDSENKDMPYNLAITRAFQITMKNGLYLLGIETPEKM
jgi:arginyl-tRNA synthetase